MYANQNGGRFPERFEDLLLTQDVTSEVFICPSSQGERAQGATLEEVAKNLSNPLHLTYVYCGKGLDHKSPADAIVAYEIADSHNKDGMNFLYADGHVEFHNRESAHFVAEVAAGHNPPRPIDKARSAGR